MFHYNAEQASKLKVSLFSLSLPCRPKSFKTKCGFMCPVHIGIQPNLPPMLKLEMNSLCISFAYGKKVLACLLAIQFLFIFFIFFLHWGRGIARSACRFIHRNYRAAVTAAPQKAVNHWLGDTTMMLVMMMMTMRRDARCEMRTHYRDTFGWWVDGSWCETDE